MFCADVLQTMFVFNLEQSDRKDPQGNVSLTGFEVLLHKQLKGKQMQKEMADFIRERYHKVQDPGSMAQGPGSRVQVPGRSFFTRTQTLFIKVVTMAGLL